MRILKIGAASTIIPGMAFIPLPVGLWSGRIEGFFLGIFRDLISKKLFEKSFKLILGFYYTVMLESSIASKLLKPKLINKRSNLN